MCTYFPASVHTWSSCTLVTPGISNTSRRSSSSTSSPSGTQFNRIQPEPLPHETRGHTKDDKCSGDSRKSFPWVTFIIFLILRSFIFERFFIVYVGNIQYVEVSTHRGRIKTEEKGKGRRCCLGDWNDSIPCRASYFAQGWCEERDEFIPFFISSWCKSSYSSYRPGAINPFLQVVLVQNS